MKKTIRSEHPALRCAAFMLLTAGLAAGLFLGACSRSNGVKTGDLVLSGNIEVTDAQLGFKIPGRVVSRPVFEGNRVQAGTRPPPCITGLRPGSTIERIHYEAV